MTSPAHHHPLRIPVLHDRDVASGLARNFYHGVSNAPQDLVGAFRLGPTRESLGITVPLVWLANLACDFRGAYAPRRDANSDDDDCDDDGDDDGDDDDDDDDEDDDDGTIATSTTTRRPRTFAPHEQLRFESLQLAFREERHGIEVIERRGAAPPPPSKAGPFLVLSPRMIVGSGTGRRGMRKTLMKYLERWTMVDNLGSSCPGRYGSAEGTEGGRGGVVIDDTVVGGRGATTTAAMARGAGKKNGRTKGKKKKGRKRQQQQQQQGGGGSTEECDEEKEEERGQNDGNDRAPLYAWCCDYCRVASFPTFQMAVEHERACTAYLKSNEKEEIESIVNAIGTTTKPDTSRGRGKNNGTGGTSSKKRGNKASSSFDRTKGGEPHVEDEKNKVKKGKDGKVQDEDDYTSSSDDDQISTAGSLSSSTSSSSSTSGGGGRGSNESEEGRQTDRPRPPSPPPPPRSSLSPVEDDWEGYLEAYDSHEEKGKGEEEWTPVPSTQSRKKPSAPVVVAITDVVGRESEDENQNNKEIGKTDANVLRDYPPATAPSTTTSTSSTMVKAVAKISDKKTRIYRNIPPSKFTPPSSAKDGLILNGATTPSALATDDEKTKNKQEEVFNQPTPCITISSLTTRDIAQKKITVMKSSTIDYDHRVNDTALPQPDHDAVQSSFYTSPVPAHDPDEPTGQSISTKLPQILTETTAATTVATSSTAEARLADDITTSTLLLRVSSLTFENDMLKARNAFLIEQNEALLSTLSEAKRQSVESVQQVHLKAYIAETARSAAEDRATRLENLLVDITMDIVVEKVVRREVHDAIFGTAAFFAADSSSLKSSTRSALRTKARAMRRQLAKTQAESAPMPHDAPQRFFPQPSQRLVGHPQRQSHAPSSPMMSHRPSPSAPQRQSHAQSSPMISHRPSPSAYYGMPPEDLNRQNMHMVRGGMHPSTQFARRTPPWHSTTYARHQPRNSEKKDFSGSPWVPGNDNQTPSGSSAAKGASAPASPEFESILSRLRRGDHAS